MTQLLSIWIAVAGMLAANAAVPDDRLDPALTAIPGDPQRGRAAFVSRDGGHCILCHAAPGVEGAGNVGPALHGVGKRYDAAQLRLRVADITRVRPDAAMPAFYRRDGLSRVAPGYRDKTILDAQQVEDIVAYLGTLR